MYKYSSEYDEILDIECDVKFINGILSNSEDLNIALEQLRAIYNMEYLNQRNMLLNNSDKKNIEIENSIINNLNSRNLALINYCSFIYTNLPDEIIIPVMREYKGLIGDYQVSCLEKVLHIYNNSLDNNILNKKRNISKYQSKLELLSSEKEKEKGK